jgi:cobalt-zinc-cadmium efflux system protein
VAIVVADAYWVDAAASIVIAVLVLWSSWGLLRDTVHVLLEGTPSEMDAERVIEVITATGSVDEVHHLHVWSLASDAPALSAHLVVDGSLTMHDAQERAAVVRRALEAEFGLIHSTLELECHPCLEDEHH